MATSFLMNRARDYRAYGDASQLVSEETGRSYLVEKGVPESIVGQLDLLGFSGISNVLSCIKAAKYYEMTENDIMITVLTDSMDLYRSRIHEMHQEYGSILNVTPRQTSRVICMDSPQIICSNCAIQTAAAFTT